MARAAKTKEMQQTNKEAKAEGLKATKIPSQMVNSSVKGTWKKKNKIIFPQRKRFRKKNKCSQKTFGSLGVCQKYVLVWHWSFDDDVFSRSATNLFLFPITFKNTCLNTQPPPPPHVIYPHSLLISPFTLPRSLTGSQLLQYCSQCIVLEGTTFGCSAMQC